jgi:hypothetical protein
MEIVAELYEKESAEVKEEVEKRRLSDIIPAEEESCLRRCPTFSRASLVKLV